MIPLLVVGILIWLFFWYSHSLVTRLRETRASANETIAWFWAGTQVPLSMFAEVGTVTVCSSCGNTGPSLSSRTSGDMLKYCEVCDSTTVWFIVSIMEEQERRLLFRRTSDLFQELVSRLEYVTVLTDTLMRPQVVNGVAVPDTISRQQREDYLEMISYLDDINSPIPIANARGDVIGYLHYGSDDLSRELLMVPYIELAVLVMLALAFLYIIRGELRREKELSWIGFAKETAHQISTPLSSLMGWVELLREKPDSEKDPEIMEAVDCIENDIQRLNQIASRYGQMGKTPKLEKQNLNPVILDSVHYFCGRPGFVDENISIETDFRSQSKVMINRVLMGWVIENLLKNALASLSGVKNGIISLSTRDIEEGPGLVELEIADNGRGIPFRDQKKIFRAGFSTRRGGWGLGLPLARRIVEEYHGGVMRLKASSPGMGTTFIIVIPSVPEEDE